MEEKDVKTTYGTLHVYKKGNGPNTILLLHGSGCDNAMLSWLEVMEALDDTYTVYAPDLLGYGKSEKPAGLCGEKFYDTHVQSLEALTASLKLESFLLAGLSMGGAIAAGYAFKNPAQVKALFLVDPWGISPALPFHRLSHWFIQKTNFTLWQYNWIARHKWLTRWFLTYALIGDKKNITEEITYGVWKACCQDQAGKSMQDYQRSSCNRHGAIPFYEKEWTKLPMPIIFIHGELDPLVPVKHLQRMKELLPHGKFYIFKGCKHWSVKEKPEEFSEIVRQYTKHISF